MSDAEEKEFLRPWAEQAQTGAVLVLSPIREALSLQLGRKIAASAVYKFMSRQMRFQLLRPGWRKVAPDTRHPNSDPQIQEAWKKNSRKIWLPC